MPVRLHQYSFRDYLLVEEMSAVKHEYLDGEIYAMAGGSIHHAALTAAAMIMLSGQVRGRCRTYSSDLRIRVATSGLASYPDVSVVCGPVQTDPENKETVLNPAVVLEVLSPSTIDYDLGQKFEHYRQIDSLKAVAYVWQDQLRIEVRERVGDVWRTTVSESGDSAIIQALDCQLDADAL
ncbi:MAG TPA: Uma2 family endonuclease, partial [Polyangia bacterium]|nr:Uma2 family endonuclease [Polyangia bacterium]